jgi:hypothetical protein
MDFVLSNEDTQRLADARDALPFPTALPKFQTRVSHNVTINSSTGRVKTSALTLHCDSLHVNLVSKLLTRFYEEADTDEKFVPHAMLHGNDPDHLSAYRQAIILQNQFLANVRVLPVIGLHSKAMHEIIQLDDEEPTEVITLIRRYPHFTSIEPTPSSETLGKYIFLTTIDKFEVAKRFIIDTLPKIWQQINNTFLEELPSSVCCPRLTNSNLRDESTRKTVAMLSKSPLPDGATVESKWSAPPWIHKLPNSVSVNYSDNFFPELQKSKAQYKSFDPSTNDTANHSKTTHIDNVSTHSNVSATSAGTNFTCDDAQSLFTSLTESFVEKMDNQNALILNMTTKQDKKFEKMMLAFQALENNNNLH